jgi:hypothetical protein
LLSEALSPAAGPAATPLPPGAFLPGFAVWISRSVLQAEEAVANLPVRLAVRVRCRQPSLARSFLAGSCGVLKRQLRATHGVLLAYSTVYRHRVPPGQYAARDPLLPAELLPPARAHVQTT